MGEGKRKEKKTRHGNREPEAPHAVPPMGVARRDMHTAGIGRAAAEEVGGDGGDQAETVAEVRQHLPPCGGLAGARGGGEGLTFFHSTSFRLRQKRCMLAPRAPGILWQDWPVPGSPLVDGNVSSLNCS